jgi:hypothetical protein
VSVSELKRAAQRLGVTTTVLRQQGWRCASDARVDAVLVESPAWLIEERARRRAHVELQTKARLRAALGAALVDVVEDQLVFELKCADNPEEVAAVEARFPDEVAKAIDRARQLGSVDATHGPHAQGAVPPAVRVPLIPTYFAK